MDNRSGENSKWDKSLLKQEIDALKDSDLT